MIRVLVVDDHPVLRAGLEAVLRTEPGFVCVGTAGDGHELLAALRHTRPDVVLLDWRLGDEDGVALCRTLRAETAPPEVVLYTATADSGLEARRAPPARTPWSRRAPTSTSSSTPCAWPRASAAERRKHAEWRHPSPNGANARSNDRPPLARRLSVGGQGAEGSLVGDGCLSRTPPSGRPPSHTRACAG
jgi:CheY-like chemotaxis protein